MATAPPATLTAKPPLNTEPVAPITGGLVTSARWAERFAERPDLRQGPARLVEFREEAIARLASTPFPTRRDEDWRYSDFTRLLSQELSTKDVLAPEVDRAAFEIPGLEAYVLVTVDGAFRADLSDEVPAPVTVATVEAAIEQEPHAYWLDRTVAELHSETSNAFVALNAAFAKTSLFVHVPKDHRLDRPIHVIHLATRTSVRRMVCSQVFVVASTSAEVTVDETFGVIGEGAPLFRNHLVRGGAASNSRVKYRSIQNEALTDAHLSNASFEQQGASLVDHVRVDLGGEQVRNNLDVVHKAAGLETHMAGAFFARGRQRIDNQTFLDHAFPHGESNELYKGIVMERGVTSFNGKVIVRPDAQKTNAFQQNDNLVIGKRAEANAKPQLEIYADDVKCSHGATIGQLDEAPLFYLKARGIPQGQALAMLHRGFLLEVLERVDSGAVREYVEALLQAKFDENVTA